MRRVPILLSVVAVVLLGVLAAGRSLPTDAQDATPGPAAAHPLVGSWVLNDPQVGPSLIAFTADGIVIDAGATAPGIGSWRPTGPRAGAFTIVLQRAGEGSVGTIVVRGTAEVDAGGDALTAPFSATVVAPDGTVVGSREGTATARRIPVEPAGAQGTPLAVYPTWAPPTPGAATPTT